MKKADELFDGSNAHLVGRVFICDKCRRTEMGNHLIVTPKCHRRYMKEYNYPKDGHKSEGSLDHISW